MLMTSLLTTWRTPFQWLILLSHAYESVLSNSQEISTRWQQHHSWNCQQACFQPLKHRMSGEDHTNVESDRLWSAVEHIPSSCVCSCKNLDDRKCSCQNRLLSQTPHRSWHRLTHHHNHWPYSQSEHAQRPNGSETFSFTIVSMLACCIYHLGGWAELFG